MSTRDSEHTAAELANPPGGLLVWLVIWLEILTFGAGLAILLVQQRAAPEDFLESRMLLDQGIALTNTLLLITGGYFMAMATMRLRRTQSRAGASWVLGAVTTGGAFLLLKTIEYYHKINQGITLEYNQFFTFYWLLTGFHYLHVWLGTLLLIAVFFSIRNGSNPETTLLDTETCGAFWHMCDLIWLMLYPIVYLLE